MKDLVNQFFYKLGLIIFYKEFLIFYEGFNEN